LYVTAATLVCSFTIIVTSAFGGTPEGDPQMASSVDPCGSVWIQPPWP
jgi:hypothetical protein